MKNMKSEFFLFYYLIWNYWIFHCQTISQQGFKEFSKSICGGNCNNIACPINTVMKIQLVKMVFDFKVKEKKCFSNSIVSVSQYDEEEFDNCRSRMKLDWSQYIDSKCSNQSQCAVCQTEEMKTKHKRCSEIIDIVVKFLCIPNIFNDEIVPANSYVDLNCEYLIDHRIIIHRASVFTTYNKSNYDVINNKICSQTDVSSIISKQCSFLTKCQAGPNRLKSNGCKKNKLFLQYACVPISVLKSDDIGRNVFVNSDQTKSSNIVKTINEGIIPMSSYNKVTRKFSTKDVTWKQNNVIWIISGIIIIIVLVLICIAIIWSCLVGKWRTRQSSLFHKIKDAHFCPPPTPIDKIQIDLSPDDLLFPNHSKDYNTLIHNEVIHQLECGQMSGDYFTNTLSKHQVSIHSHLIANSSNSSNGASSSGHISSFQSDCSKGNPSTIFNYLSSEKCPPAQTYI